MNLKYTKERGKTMKAKFLVIFLIFTGCIDSQPKKSGKTVKDIDGNVYHTVTIGTQTWMVENLRVTKYRDGTPIPLITDSIEWAKLNNGAYCNYKNDLAIATIYGRLYNYYTIIDQRKLCPKGWHVPSDKEWQVLIDYLGGEGIAGGKMKETGNTHWVDFSKGGATNAFSFTALPGGSREYITLVNGSSGVFDWLGMKGYFWSSTDWGDKYPWFRELQTGNPSVNRNHYNARCGFSIRCIKD
jgi:uncharacterized protein (TIGR02145 family)